MVSSASTSNTSPGGELDDASAVAFTSTPSAGAEPADVSAFPSLNRLLMHSM